MVGSTAVIVTLACGILFATPEVRPETLIGVTTKITTVAGNVTPAPSVTPGPAKIVPAGPCHTRCYQGKTRAYQHCRQIPPQDRARRNTCFRAADDALTRCLGSCS